MIKPRIIAVRVYRVSLSASVYLPTFINLTPNLFYLTQKRKSGTFGRHNIDALCWSYLECIARIAMAMQAWRMLIYVPHIANYNKDMMWFYFLCLKHVSIIKNLSPLVYNVDSFFFDLAIFPAYGMKNKCSTWADQRNRTQLGSSSAFQWEMV